MPNEDPTGVKGDPTVPPTVDDDAGVLDDDAQTTAPVDPEKEGLLSALAEERRLRQEAESEARRLKGGPQPPSDRQQTPTDAGEGATNWDDILGMGKTPPPNQPTATPEQAQGVLKWMSEAFESGEPQQMWSAFMMGYGILRNQERALEREAKMVIPDYDPASVMEVPDQVLMRITQNPHLLRGVVSKAMTVMKKAAKGDDGGNRPSTTPNAADLIAEGRKQERDLVKKTASAGVSGERPSGKKIAAADDDWLDDGAVGYLRSRGYTDPEIRTMAKDIKARQLDRQQG